MEPVIAFQDVSYGIRGKEILRHFDLEVAAGETLVLLGRSGSGKTTALKMVNALLTPISGDVTVEGKPTREWDPIRLRRRIGYVIQEAGLFPHYTVARNVARRAPSSWGGSAAGSRRASTSCFRASAFRPGNSGRAIRESCREASGSASAWRARSPPSRRSFSWTSRSVRSTP